MADAIIDKTIDKNTEANINRELTNEEKDQLANQGSRLFTLYRWLWAVIPFFILVDAIYLKFLLPINQNFALTIFIVIICIEIASIIEILNHNRVYLDTRSPVFKGIGVVSDIKTGTAKFIFSQLRDVSKPKRLSFTVSIDKRHIEIDFEDAIEIVRGDKIEVEFSPHTNHVWSWKKIN